jgi:hypothetical protein
MKTLHLFCFIVTLMFAAFVSATENTNNRLITGSFGVAWLDSGGFVHLYDGTKVTEPVPERKVYAIIAADLLEEGTDQLVYLDDARKALYVHSFKTEKTIGPFGHNVRTMAVGRCSADETYPSLFVCTFSGDSFRWTKEVMGRGWIPVSGDFVQASRCRFEGRRDPRSDLDDFVTINGEGDVYTYSTKWKTYSKVAEGKKIAAVLAGNFTSAPGDEIAMLDKEGKVFLYQNRTLEDLNLGVKMQCLAVGRNKEGLDTLYAIGPLNAFRYDREKRAWTQLLDQPLRGSLNLIATDKQILYTVRSNDLYRIEGDSLKPLSSIGSQNIILGKESITLAKYRPVSVPFKPYVNELLTPSGKNILRDAPWDHLHHHALMYAIKVNDCNFWEESNANFGTQATRTTKHASIPGVHIKVLETELFWATPEKKILLKEVRKISVEQENNTTLLDWEGKLTAEMDATLGGAGAGHYYGLGMRFVEEMDKGGRFFNDTGKNDGEIVRGDERLTPCKWMAYTAKLDGQPVTVAMFDHPSNPVPMTVFTMGEAGGAFAYMSATMNLHRKAVELKAGQTFEYKYRIAVWDGEVSPETIAKAYGEYVQ